MYKSSCIPESGKSHVSSKTHVRNAWDAERQKLKEPFSVSRLFDFSLQEEINAELGLR